MISYSALYMSKIVMLHYDYTLGVSLILHVFLVQLVIVLIQYTYVSIIASIEKKHPDSKIGLTMATIVTDVAITTIADPLLTHCWCMLPLPLLLLPLFLCGFAGWVGDG